MPYLVSPEAFVRFASTYGCGDYGTGTYNDARCSTESAPDTGYAPAETRSLSDESMLLLVTGIVLLVAATVGGILLVRRRISKNRAQTLSSPETTPSVDEPDSDHTDFVAK